jgi:inosine/xanthosine triphosphatase
VLVVLGSTRPPKLEAVARALSALSALAPELSRAEVVARDVGEAAPAMPLSLDALQEGARRRAARALELARAEGREAGLGVGLEGGLSVQGDGRAFLMSWAYVTDGSRGAWGCGGAIEVPARLARAVVDDGMELGQAADALAGEVDVRSRQGTWGVLTRGLLDRARSFELALLNALAPFFNPEAYR